MRQPRFSRPPQSWHRQGEDIRHGVAPLPRWANRKPPPHLTGEFARAAYHGAVAVASRLSRDPRVAAQVLLTDLYLSSAHDLPYTVGDAAAVTGLDAAALNHLIGRLVKEDVLRLYKRGADGAGVAPHHRVDLTPAKRAELSGYFARELMAVTQSAQNARPQTGAI